MRFELSVDTRGLLRKCLFSASDIDFKSTIQILGLDTRRGGIEIVCNPIVIETSLETNDSFLKVTRITRI